MTYDSIIICYFPSYRNLSLLLLSWDLHTQPSLGSRSLEDSEGSSSEAFAGGCRASFPAASPESQGSEEQCLNEAELCLYQTFYMQKAHTVQLHAVVPIHRALHGLPFVAWVLCGGTHFYEAGVNGDTQLSPWCPVLQKLCLQAADTTSTAMSSFT